MGAQFNLDKIILDNVGNKGFFIESGGADPTDQNNTHLLELAGWTGLLVEPKLDFNQAYSKLRPNSIVENYILVSKDYVGDTIEADCSHWMMGGVDNTHSLPNWNPTTYPCIPLNKLLEKHNISEVTLFSLDVEGYETNVLNGVDFNKVFFHILIIENHIQKGQLDDFSFLEELGFYKKHTTTGNHEFYINEKSEYFNTFTV